MWLTSFRAVLKKNWILKLRSRRLSLLEIFFPLYFLVIIIIITKTGQKLSTKVPQQIFNEIPSTSICNGCALGWAPVNMTLAQDIITDLMEHNNVTIVGFESDAAFEAAYVAGNGTLHAGIIFTGESDFSIRFNDSLLGSANASHYVSGGYIALQRAVHESLINVLAGGTAPRVQLNYTTKAYPIAAYTVPSVTYYMWAFYFPIIYGYSLVHVITGIVTEKEKKLKDAMRTMGCPPSAYWLSWFLIQLLMITLATVIFLIVAYLAGVFHWKVLPVGPIFLTFLLYALCLTTMGFLVSVFADTPRSGVIGAWLFLLLQLGLGGIGYFLVYKRAPWVETLFSFFPVVPLMNSVLMWAEAESLGIKFALSQPHATRYVIALLYDCIIYGVLAAYFEKAVNDTGGFFFFFSKDFWVPKAVPGDADDASPLLGADRRNVGIELRGLTREFERGIFKRTKQVAVDRLTLNVEKGEIFALLGHNGAGKSTTISMLTGSLPPTSGDARLLGCSVVSNVDTVRSFVGVCPQTDIIFDLLTAVEHVELFAGLKGHPVTREEARELLLEVSLDLKHADEMATGFSGGMKRKLTTALAFVGGSQVVFLDECTAGMDPYSRKKIWAMLQKYKRGRTIVLTTHYMEEADLLGDKIAIMSKGRIQAMGTSLELKNAFGLGYRLTFVKQEGSKDATIGSFLNSYFPSCSLLNTNEAEVTFQLPRTALASFPKLFAELDRIAPSLGVRSYGLSMTTLEEVFLRLSKDEAEKAEEEENL